MASIINSGKFLARDGNGVPYAGGKLHTYLAGSGGATPQATYSDQGLTTPNTNPVILDADGRADVWIGSNSFLLILKDSDDNEIWTVDNYKSEPDLQSDIDALDVDTIAALRLISGAEAQKALVNGYYVAGDGGGNDFYWDSTSTETENGGTIIKATAVVTGRWKRPDDVPLNDLGFGVVHDYNGATGTDNSTALQSILDVAGDGGHILSPKGWVYHASQLIANYDQLTIEGEGQPPRNDIKNSNNPTSSSGWFSDVSATSNITFSDGATSKKHKCIKNIGFIGENNSGVPVISLAACPKNAWFDVTIHQKGEGDGIPITSSWVQNFWGGYIEKGDTNVRTGTGIEITNPSALAGLYTFHGTTIYQWSVGCQAGEQSASPTGDVKSISFFNVQFKSNATDLDVAGGVAGCNVFGGYLEGAVARSIRVWYGAKNTNIVGAMINNPGGGSESIILGQGGGTDEEKQFFGVRITGNEMGNIDLIGTGVKVTADTVVPPESVLIEDNTFDAESGATAASAIDLSGQAGVVRLGQNEYGSNLNVEISAADLLLCASANYNNSIRQYTQHPAQEPNVETLAAGKNLTLTDSLYQFLDTGATGRTLKMPAEADSYGRMYFVENTGATTDVTIKDDAAAITIVTLTPGDAAWVICEATAGTWRGRIF